MFESARKLLAWYRRMMRGTQGQADGAGQSPPKLPFRSQAWPKPSPLATQRAQSRAIKRGRIELTPKLRISAQTAGRVIGTGNGKPQATRRPVTASSAPKRVAPARHVWMETRGGAGPRRSATIIPLHAAKAPASRQLRDAA